MVVHAGVHRTGTTSIQSALHGNAAELAQRGILYPKDPIDGALINHQRLAWDLSEEMVAADLLGDWIESLAQSDAHTVVFSAEDFCRIINLDFLDRFGEDFEIDAIFYLKRQDIWVNSWYNQHVKWPFDARLSRCTPIEFLGHLGDFHWINYFETLERWSRKIGRLRVHARVLESGQIQDPLADLCDFCGVDFDLKISSDERMNESVPAAQIGILRSIGIAQYSPDIRNVIIDAVARAVGPGTTNSYPKAVRRLILDRYTHGNQMVAERYLGRSDRVLFRDVSFPDIDAGDAQRADPQQLLRVARNLIAIAGADAGRSKPDWSAG